MAEVEGKLKAEEILAEANKGLKALEDKLSSKVDVETLEEMKTKQDEILADIQKFAHVGDKDIIEYVKALQEQNNNLETKVKDLLEGKGVKEKSQAQEIKEALTTDKYKSIAKHKGLPDDMKSYSFDVKVDDMTSANSLTETNDQIPQTQRLPGDIIAPRRPTLLYNLFPKAVATSDIITWVELTSETQGAAATTEGNEFGQSDADWTSYKQGVEKITNYVKVSREMLEDIDFVQSRINELIGYHLADTRETELLSGNGSSPHLKGITNHTKTVSLDDYEGTTAANIYDVLLAIVTQIELGNTDNSLATGFMATDLIMNNLSYLKFRSEKDANNNYVIPPFLGSNFDIAGAAVRKSQRISKTALASYVLGGDFNRGTIYLKRNINIKMFDQNEDDAIKDYVTFTASQRLALVVSNIDGYAFFYDTIENVIDAISV